MGQGEGPRGTRQPEGGAMSADARVVMGFKWVEHDEELSESVEKRCRALADEFPETTQFEVHMELEAGEVAVRVHISGRDTQFASHSRAAQARTASDTALEKLDIEEPRPTNV